MRYQVNSRDVVGEALDGEVIIIHLVTGTYYSTAASGAAIWNALIDGWSVAEIAKQLCRGTVFNNGRIFAEIRQFVASLVAEDLLMPASEDAARSGEGPMFDFVYAAPELHKYTDMQELLLVDPIHEVAEEGWPMRAGSKT